MSPTRGAQVASHLPERTFGGFFCRGCSAPWPCEAIRSKPPIREMIRDARTETDRWGKIHLAHAHYGVRLTWMEFRRILISWEDLADALEQTQKTRRRLALALVLVAALALGNILANRRGGVDP